MVSTSTRASIKHKHADKLLSPLTTEHVGTFEKESGVEKITKKRDRATLSCMRCHRLKVKCDKSQPCVSKSIHILMKPVCADKNILLLSKEHTILEELY